MRGDVEDKLIDRCQIMLYRLYDYFNNAKTMASPDDLVSADLSLQEVPETYEARETRILGAIDAKHTLKLGGPFYSGTYSDANQYWAAKYREALPEDRVKQIASARNVVIRELTTKLRSILASLPSDDEREHMLTWMEHNLIDDEYRDVVNIPSPSGSPFPGTNDFQWPEEVPRPNSGYQSISVLPKPYLDVITACTEAGMSRLVIHEPFDALWQERLVFLQSLKEGGLTPEDFESTYSRRTLLSVDSKGNTRLYLQKNEPKGPQNEHHQDRTRRVNEGDEVFMDKFKREHPLDPSTVAQIALVLDGITKDGRIEWGKLEWPRAINVTNGRLQISRAAEGELRDLRSKAGEEKISGSRDEFASKIAGLVETGGVIQVTSVPEANVALDVVTKRARAAIETAGKRAEERETAANLRAGSAEERARAAEGKTAGLESQVAELTRRLRDSEAYVVRQDKTIAGLRENLETSESVKGRLEDTARSKKSDFGAAYRTLQEELEKNKGMFGTSARLAAYGKFLETVLGFFK